jgi:probable H4MPT-linked C1 transfer pathway protein
MTAELSQMFRTKRQGVSHIIDAVVSAFPRSRIFVYAVDGRFHDPAEARQRPLLVAAANWSATATAVATEVADAILIDTGTTTTDIIPIEHGRPAAIGRTDPERLTSGELVYTGVVRTPVEAIVSEVPLPAGMAGVSAEGFALAADVHVWRGTLAPADYSSSTPDGRPATREHAGVRLARIVCADREILGDAEISAIADAVAGAQTARIVHAVRGVMARHPAIDSAVVTGVGAFLAEAAAREAGLTVIPLAERFGADAARCAPAASVALLLDTVLRTRVSA